MTTLVEEHYRKLLARHYTWMAGVPFDAKVAEQRSLLESLGLEQGAGALALDLGCGSGFQTAALAGLGYRVLAIDTSETLLDELRVRMGEAAVETRLADLCRVSSLTAAGSAAVACCMGDTLTHLPGRPAVAALFHDLARALMPGGRLVLTYRDLSMRTPVGTDRFFPVAADDTRILTCMVEPAGDEVAVITDLLHERGPDGWSFSASSYPKLRLPVAWVEERLADAGFQHLSTTVDTMVRISALR